MKKFLIAAATGLLLFSGQNTADASSIESLNAQSVQTQDMGKWARFRDDLLGRHRDDRYGPPPPPPGRHGYGPPPPPPPPDRYGYGPPPPPPDRYGYGPPPPPPDRYGYGPPPPPPR